MEVDRDEDEFEDYDDPGRRYRDAGDIEIAELTDALCQLCFLGDDVYLRMQATNISLVDQFLTRLEYEVMQKLFHEESTPGEAFFLSAQSQMWIFAAYELLRTWRGRAKEILKWSKSGGLEAKLAVFEKDLGYSHFGREMRAEQLRAVLKDPSLVAQLEVDLRVNHMPFRRIEFIRMALAKHEIAGQRNSMARMPGYGRINQWCGSLDYELEKGMMILGTISRRDIADELRAMGDRSVVPSEEDISSFNEFMDFKPEEHPPFETAPDPDLQA